MSPFTAGRRPSSKDVMRGTLDLLILKALSRAHTRLGHRPTAGGSIPRWTPDRPGVSLSRSPTLGRERVDRQRMESHRPEPSDEDL